MSPASATTKPAEQATPLVFEDPFSGVYKKLLFYARRHAPAGRHPGGRCRRLRHAVDAGQERRPLPCKPHELIRRQSAGAAARRRCEHAGRGPSLLLQQRHQGRHLHGHPRAGLTRSGTCKRAPKPAPAAAAVCRWSPTCCTREMQAAGKSGHQSSVRTLSRIRARNCSRSSKRNSSKPLTTFSPNAARAWL